MAYQKSTTPNEKFMITQIEGFNEKVINEINNSGSISELFELQNDVLRELISYNFLKAEEHEESVHT